MSRLSQVIKEKNRLEKAEKKRRQMELQDVRQDTAYRAKLYDEMQAVKVMLDDPDVEAVYIEIPERYVTLFARAAYSDEMAEYTLEIDGTRATIRRRLIQI